MKMRNHSHVFILQVKFCVVLRSNNLKRHLLELSVRRAHHFKLAASLGFLEGLSREVSQGGRICCRCMFFVLISPLTLKVGGNG